MTILNPDKVLFEGQARSVFVPGDLAEFEILDYHAPIVSLLRAGSVIIDGKTTIPVSKGMVKFDREECVILADA